MPRRRTLISLLLVSALCCPWVLASTARADGPKDLLDLIPADAWGFVTIGSLDSLGEKATLLNEVLGVQIPPPQALLAMLGLVEAVDTTRPLCIVMMDAQKFGASEAAVILAPTTDPKAALETLLAEEPVEGIQACTIMGQPAYAAFKGKFLIIGPSEDCVRKVAKTEKTIGSAVGKARLAAIQKSDLHISIALGAVFGAYKDMVVPMLQMMLAASDPEGKTVENITKGLSEIASLDVSVHIGKDGVSIAVLTSPKKDSDMEKLFRDTKNTDKSLLSLLPKEKYLIAAAGTYHYSEHSEKFGDMSALSSLFRNAQFEGPNEEALATMESAIEELAKLTGNFAGSFSALPPGAGGMIGLAIVVETRNPEEYVASFRKLFEAIMNLSDDVDFEAIKENIVHKAEAETIAGRKIDTIAINWTGLAEQLDLEEDDLTEVRAVIGKDEVLRFGPAGAKHIVVAYGGGKKRFETICDGVKSGSKGLSADPGIASVSTHLPKPRASEGYFALDNIGNLIKSIAKAVGEDEGFTFDVPTVDAPIAISTVQLDSAQKMDIVVPMKLITSMKKFIDEMTSQELGDFDEDEDEADDDEDKDEGETKDKDEDEI